ncbi:bleomycin hydrolase [Arachidicoccus rhizosphaerae]|uniref:Aminopeptidase n=1 Tax=Arachidicoccus rhizosphaerae TaxID=551991 RepID=A0A1H3Z7Y7_9BACT|nr:C1 family peptidase [Arachidicoccus rhizosphaerae]SEA19770.1 bleomycin hydrolase [Arachidicoccus rhizosphaerae]
MKRTLLSAFAVLVTVSMATAQVNLVKKASENATDAAKQGFQFTNVIDLSTTPVENQGSSGTCWSYSANSFLESEMIKNGQAPVHLSKIYTVRNAYMEKAEAYVLMQGGLSWGDGGEGHDVINMYAKYGTLPESDYTGLVNGKQINQFGPMQKKLKALLDSVVATKGQIDPAAWRAEFKKILDDSLGAVPASFQYKGKTYTPETFAKEVAHLDADNYIEFISQTSTPYYKKAMMMASDNWAFQWDYNITPTDMTDVIDNALKNGYTVGWGADVSEPYFSWPNGVAFVPKNAEELEGKKLTRDEKSAIYNGDRTELVITPENRQQGLEDYTTTDDHGMHIVGMAKDQDGKEFYIVKNSWGTKNDYKGFLYVSKAYVQYKTTSLLVNKKSVPKNLAKKISM